MRDKDYIEAVEMVARAEKKVRHEMIVALDMALHGSTNHSDGLLSVVGEKIVWEGLLAMAHADAVLVEVGQSA